MNALLVVLLAAVASAAPGGLLHHGTVVAHPGAITYSAVHAPAVAHVQVPLTKTVHYETKPVVTGYSTSIIKPAIAQVATPVLPAVHHVAQPVQIVQGNSYRQIPDFPQIPSIPSIPGQNGSADAPQIPMIPMIPSFPGQNNSIVSIPSIPSFPEQFHYANNPYVVNIPEQKVVVPAPAPVAVAQPVAVAAPVVDAEVIEARAAVPVAAPAVVHHAAPAVYHSSPVQYSYAAPAPIAVAPQVVAVRAPQAGDFGPLVTKEQVLAPVRTHTEITPQITQIQPEVTVRKVIHDVPVAHPVAVQTPVEFRVAQPAIAFNHHQQFAGQQFVF